MQTVSLFIFADKTSQITVDEAGRLGLNHLAAYFAAIKFGVSSIVTEGDSCPVMVVSFAPFVRPSVGDVDAKIIVFEEGFC